MVYNRLSRSSVERGIAGTSDIVRERGGLAARHGQWGGGGGLGFFTHGLRSQNRLPPNPFTDPPYRQFFEISQANPSPN